VSELAPIVTRVALSGESGVQVDEVDPPIVIWGRPGRDDNVIVAVRADGTIDPHPSGVIVQPAAAAQDPFAPR
jgi:hypothetical protein